MLKTHYLAKFRFENLIKVKLLITLRRSGVFIVNFDRISDLVLVFL